MYQTRNNDLQMKIHLEDIELQLVMGGHSQMRTRQRIGCNVSDVFYRIALLLETPCVSKHINETVCVGQECVVFDADTGFTYIIVVGLEEVFVKTVYSPQKYADLMRVSKDNFCMFVKQAEVLCADVFGNAKTQINQLAAESAGLCCPV